MPSDTLSKSWIEKDQKNLWHPLTQHKNSAPPLGVVKAEGAVFFDENGKTYIDGIASWYTTMYGHGNKQIVEAMTQQMRELDFVMFSGFTHRPAVELSERLLQLLPANQKRIFFNDNGSTAIEAGIKMALQYHHNRGEQRNVLIAFEDGFHGDTFGAMSASGLSVYNGPFEDFLLNVKRIPVPQDDNLDGVVAQLNKIVQENACACFVFEPLVQGAAGMKFHSAKGLDTLLKICKEAGVICIADEIMTGFGKTGKNFACEYLEQQPDIICMSKALTAGMFPLSITSVSEQIFEAFLSDELHKGFFHAHTYSAHPVGCAAALSGLELLNSEYICERRNYIAEAHKIFVAKISSHPMVLNARSMGVILAIDMDVKTDRYGNFRDRLYQFFMDSGVNLRPLGNTIYTVPPYVISNEQLLKIHSTMEEALDEFESEC